MKEAILSVKNLQVSFSMLKKGLRREEQQVISDLDIDLYPGEILAIVGSSGSGKSLLAHAILGLLPENATVDGTFVYKGSPLTKADQERLRGREIALVPQSVNFLDPLMRVGKQVQISDKSKSDKHIELFKKYGLPEAVLSYYPHQLSGGMARKVLLATALASDAQVILADEPTPGLDEASVKEVLSDFKKLADAGKSVLMITHDIEAALKIADQIAIFYAGTTLEVANVEDFDQGLRHPYTKALFNALPSEKFVGAIGTQPLPHELPLGCLYHERCSDASALCKAQRPHTTQLRNGKVRCNHAT